MKRFQYPVLFTLAHEGGYVVTCRDLPPLVTQGDDEPEALAQAADSMDETFAAFMFEGLDFPEPSKARRRERLVSPSAETMAKAAPYVALREAGISKTQLDEQLGVDGKGSAPPARPALRLQAAALGASDAGDRAGAGMTD